MAGRAYAPYNSYSGNLAREKRRRFFIRLSVSMFCGVMLGGISAYALFYSGWLDVNSISINGLKSITEDQVSPTIKTMIEENVVPILRIRFQKNVLFFDPGPVKKAIIAQFPVIRTIEISKELPHKIIVDIIERNAWGTWCANGDSSSMPLRQSSGQATTSCRYFDEEGVLWGKSLRSSGVLLLNVEDLRKIEGQNKISPQLLAGIKELVAGLGNIDIKINKIEIPADFIGEFRTYTTRSYYLIFNINSSIKEQINVLRILLKEKGEGFNPQYIDLKIEGRAYFK